jgi:hypothetical protein
MMQNGKENAILEEKVYMTHFLYREVHSNIS